MLWLLYSWVVSAFQDQALWVTLFLHSLYLHVDSPKACLGTTVSCSLNHLHWAWQFWETMVLLTLIIYKRLLWKLNIIMHKNWNIASIQNIWAFNFINITIIIILGKRCWSWPFCLLRNSRRWWWKILFGQPWDRSPIKEFLFKKWQILNHICGSDLRKWEPGLGVWRALSCRDVIFPFRLLLSVAFFGRICPWSPYQHWLAVIFIPIGWSSGSPFPLPA